MKIIYKKGDFLEGPEHYKLHGCNAQGVMGSGAAWAVKNKYPQAFQDYVNTLRRVKFLRKNTSCMLGEIVCSRIKDDSNPPRIICIFSGITQEYYGRDKNVVYVDYDAIKNVIRNVNQEFDYGYPLEVAMPKIGAGLANGDWGIISEIIERDSTYFQPVVYELI